MDDYALQVNTTVREDVVKIVRFIQAVQEHRGGHQSYPNFDPEEIEAGSVTQYPDGTIIPTFTVKGCPELLVTWGGHDALDEVIKDSRERSGYNNVEETERRKK